ncbi:MAG: hypothetical protein Q7T33_11035 [Dehalococcoidia bacterium]|nr:hypothetical protein [Dehalococcoidia bacterium]
MFELLSASTPFGFSPPALSIAGSAGVIGAAIALGIRHGIDWDHIAAITDITSTTAAVDTGEKWLVSEPGVMLTDESHHKLAGAAASAGTASAQVAVEEGEPSHTHRHLSVLHHPHNGPATARNGHLGATIDTFVRKQRPALLLGTMYALGHGSVVFALGLLALLAREFLPDWIDPVMERVVGVTLLFLAAYLFYSIYRFFRGGDEFQMRSRWMLVFAAVRNGFELIRSRLLGRPHHHVHEAQRYGVRTAYGIGMIHGVGAETGTQVLVITTAVGAGSQLMGVVALAGFLVGLIISNSVVTVISAAGFVSSRQRQWIYVAAGIFAAVFSLVVGTFFLLRASDILPDLDRFFGWLGPR